ncbi:hypothetical protein [Roseivirga sp. E12]|uniref:hypothetical protein n=1 Tax=Roseivirga sp. E12 TaxID=2819237 RepID=UPI001ABBE2DF|nr:hypothetical protein [Roseivirga sp. E12]MBO3700398.1 hypothetical protein [Roseivirga sp. E12]
MNKNMKMLSAAMLLSVGALMLSPNQVKAYEFGDRYKIEKCTTDEGKMGGKCGATDPSGPCDEQTVCETPTIE